MHIGANGSKVFVDSWPTLTMCAIPSGHHLRRFAMRLKIRKIIHIPSDVDICGINSRWWTPIHSFSAEWRQLLPHFIQLAARSMMSQQKAFIRWNSCKLMTVLPICDSLYEHETHSCAPRTLLHSVSNYRHVTLLNFMCNFFLLSARSLRVYDSSENSFKSTIKLLTLIASVWVARLVGSRCAGMVCSLLKINKMGME